MLHECGPPAPLIVHEKMPQTSEGIHRIADPCAVAAEASTAHEPDPAMTVAHGAEVAAPGGPARLLLLPPPGRSVPSPPRTRARQKVDLSLRSAPQRKATLVVDGTASANGRQQATVRQAQGTSQSSMPAHYSMAMAAIGERLHGAGPASLSPAGSDGQPPASAAAASAAAADAAKATAWQPRGWRDRGRDDPVVGASRPGSHTETATGSAAVAGPPVSGFGMAESVRSAIAEALAAARVPLTAGELALLVRRDSRAASDDAAADSVAPLEQLLQVRAEITYVGVNYKRLAQEKVKNMVDSGGSVCCVTSAACVCLWRLTADGGGASSATFCTFCIGC